MFHRFSSLGPARPLRLARRPVALACLVALAGSQSAFACDANSAASLAACIGSVQAGGVVNITGNITLDRQIGVVIDKDLTINGGGHTLDGGGIYRGFFVGAGTVAINDLAMTRMTAKGGDGGSGANGGGGGMGAGGAVFVRSGANVTLRNVSFSGNSAAGGHGGDGYLASDGRPFLYGGGAGGGMGGNGGGPYAGGGGTLGGAGGGGGLFENGGEAQQDGRGGVGGGPAGGQPAEPGVRRPDPTSGPGGDYSGGAGSSAGNALTDNPAGLAGAGGFGGGGGGLAGDVDDVLFCSFHRSTVKGGGGGFGGGGGGAGMCLDPADPGGFGGGSGGGWSRSTGFGGGTGGDRASNNYGGGGGGGAGMGADVFVMDGASLTVLGTFSASGGSVAGGQGGRGASEMNAHHRPAYDGSAFGSGIFIQGSGAVLTFAPESGTQTVANDIADQTGSGGAGANAGSVGILKAGGGTLVLSGNNTYTGGTTVSGGTLAVAGAASLGAGVLVLEGAQLTVQSSATIAPSNFTVTGSGTLAAATGTTMNFAPGTASLAGSSLRVGTVQDAGTVEMGGNLLSASTGLASLHVGGGRLVYRRDLVDVNPGVLRVDAGATIDFAEPVVNLADPAGIAVTALQGEGTLRVDPFYAGLSVTEGNFSGSITGARTLYQKSGGVLVLTGSNDYGSTFVEGTLQIGAGGATGTLGQGSVTLAALLNGDVVTPLGVLVFNRSNPLTVGNLINGFGTLYQVGSGPLVLTGANDYGGVTRIAAGSTLQVGDGGATGSLGTSSVQNAGTLAFNRSDNVVVANAIEGSGNVRQEGAGTLILVAGNTYSGTTTINTGVLQVGNGGTTGSIGTGNIQNTGTLVFNRSDNVVVANAIEGSGNVRQDGAGTLILVAGNTYSGATTINTGVLQVGSGGTAGSLGTGAVLNDAVLAFNRSDDVTVGNAIGGTGSVRKLGAGRLVFTGAGTYTGPTSVEAGTLSVNGSLASAVSVFSGATLGGSGRVGSVNVAAGGTLGAGNSIGVLTTGDLVLAPGSTLQVEADAAGEADRIDAANITVEGASVQVLAEPGRYARNTRYTILTHGGSRTGSFAGVSSNLAFLTPSLSYEPGAVLLELSAQDAPVYGSVAATPNQAVVANYLQAFADAPATEEAAGLISRVDGMDAGQARRAFETLAGSAHAAASQVAQAVGRNFRQMLLVRGSAGDTGAERATTSAGFTTTVQGTKEPGDAGSRKGLGLAQDAARAAGRGLWVQAIGGGGRSESDGNGGDLRYGASGLVAGFDHEVDSRWMLGAALGRTRSHWTSNVATGALGSGAITSYQAGAYARRSFGPWNVMVDGTYGLHRFTTHRTVDLGAGAMTASSGHRAREWALGTLLEYAPDTLEPGVWQMRPVAGLRHARFSEDAFAESGAGAASLAVAGRKASNTMLQAGAKWLHAFGDGKGDVQLQALVSHLAGDNDAPVTARMAGQAASFAASGTPLPRDALTLSGAVNRQVSPTLGFFASAAVEYRGSSYSAWSVVAGLRKKW